VKQNDANQKSIKQNRTVTPQGTVKNIYFLGIVNKTKITEKVFTRKYFQYLLFIWELSLAISE